MARPPGCRPPNVRQLTAARGLPARPAPGARCPRRRPPSPTERSQPCLSLWGAPGLSGPVLCHGPNSPPGRGGRTIVQCLQSLHPQALVGGDENRVKQRFWEERGHRGMTTSSRDALGHPKPHRPPGPALSSLGSDSSEAPPGRGGETGEERGEAPPRRGLARGASGPPKTQRSRAPRLVTGRVRRGASPLTACRGAAVPGRPAQREQQPQRPARGRAHAARPDGAAAAAVVVAVRSAQQVTSPSERRKEVGAGREEARRRGKE